MESHKISNEMFFFSWLLATPSKSTFNINISNERKKNENSKEIYPKQLVNSDPNTGRTFLVPSSYESQSSVYSKALTLVNGSET